jgi:putative heme-binding domain-containing protein
MEEMKAGNIRPSVMPPMKQWVYGRSSVPEIKSLAGELFGKTASSRNAVIEEYLPALSSHASNRENGAKALQKGTCLACHRIDGKGSAVGPDLADVQAKPRAALLTDILDPNRVVEERWIAYAIELRDGTTATGLVDSEDDQSVTLKTPGGMTQTFARTNIKTMSSTETSLMPVGLEAALPPEDMADLIDLLKNR